MRKVRAVQIANRLGNPSIREDEDSATEMKNAMRSISSGNDEFSLDIRRHLNGDVGQLSNAKRLSEALAKCPQEPKSLSKRLCNGGVKAHR